MFKFNTYINDIKKIILSTFYNIYGHGLDIIKAQARIDFEKGVVFTGCNDVRIPGDQGTLFLLKRRSDSKVRVFLRLIDLNALL